METQVHDYIASFSTEVQAVLLRVRSIIMEEAPQCSEVFLWKMPTYKGNKSFIHFAAAKHHLGIYPGPDGIAMFAPTFQERGYKYSKGAVQFPFNQPIPYDLIRDIVRYQIEDDQR